MLEFFLITAFYLLGQCFDVMAKVSTLRKSNKTANFKQIWRAFFQEEWHTLIVSGLGLFLIQLSWIVIHVQKISVPDWLHHYGGIYGVSLIVGYAGQRLIYKYLSKGEDAVSGRIDTNSAKIN